MASPRRYRVARAYRAAYPNEQYPSVFAMRAGDLLTIGKTDPENPGWTWCTNDAGDSGWVPESYMSISGERAHALRDYTGVELTVEPGEELAVVLEESGWAWATNDRGEVGWVPLANLDKPE